MESLYQTDLFVEQNHDHLNGEEKDVETVDPYIQHASSSINASKAIMKCKDRISVMELHSVDQQVEQYAIQNNQVELTKCTMMDLYANDVDIDVAQEREEKKDEVGAILELYGVDKSIKKMANHDAKAKEAEIIRILHNLDLQVDGLDESSSTSIEEMHETENRGPIEAVIRAKSTAHVISPQIRDLIQTDLDVDGVNQKDEIQDVRALFKVDCEIDRQKASHKKEDHMSDINQLYQIDCQIKDMEYQIPLRDELEGTTDDIIMSELFAVDLEMEVRHEAKETKCEIDAILDLYHVDQRVDTAKHSESLEVYCDLYQLDLSIDVGGKSSVCADDFVDPMMKAMMRQYQVRSAAQVIAVCKGTAEVAELLSVDLEMDGLNQNCGMLDVAALLAVDDEIRTMAKRNKHEKELHDIYELYEMDQLVGGVDSSREYNVPAKDNLDRAVKYDLDLTLHSREGVTDDIIMSELFAVDLEMEVRHEAKETKCEIDAILDLYHVDQRVDTAKHSESLEVYCDLYQLDLSIDVGGKSSVCADDFVDPMMKAMMRQYQVRSAAQVNAFCDFASQIACLLSVDLEVDDSKRNNELEALASLLQIDSEMGKAAQHIEYKSGVQDLKQLYAMDTTIDGSFRSLLETDQAIDGAHVTLQLVDPIAQKQSAKGKTAIESSFDLGELLFTDLEVEVGRKNDIKQTRTRERRNSATAGDSASNSETLTRRRSSSGRGENDATEFIEHIFGIPTDCLVPKVDVAKVTKVDSGKKTESSEDNTGDALIRHLFGTGLLDVESDSDSGKSIEPKRRDDETSFQSQGRTMQIASFFGNLFKQG